MNNSGGRLEVNKSEVGGLSEIGETLRAECVDSGQCFSSLQQVSRQAGQMKAHAVDEKGKG